MEGEKEQDGDEGTEKSAEASEKCSEGSSESKRYATNFNNFETAPILAQSPTEGDHMWMLKKKFSVYAFVPFGKVVWLERGVQVYENPSKPSVFLDKPGHITSSHTAIC
jgi:hypothetical protein